MKQPPQHRNRQLQRRYGITLYAYTTLLSEQGNTCAICKEPPTVVKALYVDHDHESGKIRGLLCHGCNTALGQLRDNKSTLVGVLLYLLKEG